MYMKYSIVGDVKPPVRANFGDAIDFFVPNDLKNIELEPNSNAVIPAAIKVEVPFGYALVLMNKSGVAVKRELVVGACVIDHGYSGEIHIDLHNVGTETQVIEAGQKIVQGLLIPVSVPSLIEVDQDELYTDVLLASGRGSGKMGSTGTV